MADEAPKTLGRYEIVSELGKGAMGVVYEGRDPNIGRRVAIKTARIDVLEASGRAEELMERFLREARAAGTLNHPNIVTIYDADEENGLAYIAMEFLEGGDLRDYLKDHPAIEIEESIRICAQVCEGLDAAHKQGVVHRDVKPANVILLEDGSVKLADFGIARVEDSHLTQEGAMIGTPQYMSPEQFQGKKIDARSDLFSVGVMVYEMITNEKPFTGEALSTIMTSVIQRDPIPPSQLNTSVDPVLSDVVMKCLSKSPTRRYQSGAELAAALKESLKPAPNPSIIRLQSFAPAPEDPTVLAPSASEDETVLVPDQSVPSADPITAALPDSPPVEAPREAPAPGPPPSETGSAEGRGASSPSLTQTGLGERKSPITAITVGGGLLVVAAVIAYFGTRGDAPGNFYSSVEITVLLCPDQAAYAAWDGSTDVPPSWIRAEGATVTVYNSKKDRIKLNSDTTHDGVARVGFSGQYESVYIVAAMDEYTEADYGSLKAERPDEVVKWPIMLLHQSVREGL